MAVLSLHSRNAIELSAVCAEISSNAHAQTAGKRVGLLHPSQHVHISILQPTLLAIHLLLPRAPSIAAWLRQHPAI